MNMPLSNQSVALLLVALFAVAPITYAAKPKIIEVPASEMTVREARTSMIESIRKMMAYQFPALGAPKVIVNRNGMSFDYKGRRMDTQAKLPFTEMSDLSVRKNGATGGYVVCSNSRDLVFLSAEQEVLCPAWFNTEHNALKFVDALLTLKKNAASPDTEEVNFTAFVTSAQTWLATTPKPEMTDEVLTLKLVAEDAFKRKDFPAALDAYGQALDKFPMWPEGHYNAALLAAEIEDYELAAQHMHRYLALSPDAKDAAAAKGKFLLWQHKAKE